MAAVTGVRIGELLGLRWFNVDLKRRSLEVTHGLWRGQLQTPKTEGSIHGFQLSEMITSVLAGHRRKSPFSGEDDFVFCKADGSPSNQNYLRKKVLYPAMDRLGIKRGHRTHGFHIFRHTAGSITYTKTGDIKAAQTLLGHTQIGTTADIYVHAGAGDAKVVASAIEEAFSGFAHNKNGDSLKPNRGLWIVETL